MRQKMTHSVMLSCAYCQERSKVKINPEVGFKGVKLCPNPECRFRFEFTITSIADGKMTSSYRLLGIQAHDRLPWNGLIQAQKSKVSGSAVLLYRTANLNLSSSKEYAMICVKHDTANFCFLDTYKEVLTYLGKPHLWCDGCKAEHSPEK